MTQSLSSFTVNNESVNISNFSNFTNSAFSPWNSSPPECQVWSIINVVTEWPGVNETDVTVYIKKYSEIHLDDFSDAHNPYHVGEGTVATIYDDGWHKMNNTETSHGNGYTYKMSRNMHNGNGYYLNFDFRIYANMLSGLTNGGNIFYIFSGFLIKYFPHFNDSPAHIRTEVYRTTANGTVSTDNLLVDFNRDLQAGDTIRVRYWGNSQKTFINLSILSSKAEFGELKINNGNDVDDFQDDFQGEISYGGTPKTTKDKLLQLGTNTITDMVQNYSLPIEYKNFNFGLFDDMLVSSSAIGFADAYQIQQTDENQSFCVELHRNDVFVGWAGGIHADPNPVSSLSFKVNNESVDISNFSSYSHAFSPWDSSPPECQVGSVINVVTGWPGVDSNSVTVYIKKSNSEIHLDDFSDAHNSYHVDEGTVATIDDDGWHKMNNTETSHGNGYTYKMSRNMHNGNGYYLNFDFRIYGDMLSGLGFGGNIFYIDDTFYIKYLPGYVSIKTKVYGGGELNVDLNRELADGDAIRVRYWGYNDKTVINLSILSYNTELGELKINNENVFQGEIMYVENPKTTKDKLLQLGTNTTDMVHNFSLPIEYKNFNFGLFDDMLVASSAIGFADAYQIQVTDVYQSFCVELHYNDVFLGRVGGIHADPYPLSSFTVNNQSVDISNFSNFSNSAFSPWDSSPPECQVGTFINVTTQWEDNVDSNSVTVYIKKSNSEIHLDDFSDAHNGNFVGDDEGTVATIDDDGWHKMNNIEGSSGNGYTYKMSRNIHDGNGYYLNFDFRIYDDMLSGLSSLGGNIFYIDDTFYIIYLPGYVSIKTKVYGGGELDVDLNRELADGDAIRVRYWGDGDKTVINLSILSYNTELGELKINNENVFQGEIMYVENPKTTKDKLLQLGTNTTDMVHNFSLPIEYKNFNFGLFDDMLVASSAIGFADAYQIQVTDVYQSFCVELHYNDVFLGRVGGIHADPYPLSSFTVNNQSVDISNFSNFSNSAFSPWDSSPPECQVGTFINVTTQWEDNVDSNSVTVYIKKSNSEIHLDDFSDAHNGNFVGDDEGTVATIDDDGWHKMNNIDESSGNGYTYKMLNNMHEGYYLNFDFRIYGEMLSRLSSLGGGVIFLIQNSFLIRYFPGSGETLAHIHTMVYGQWGDTDNDPLYVYFNRDLKDRDAIRVRYWGNSQKTVMNLSILSSTDTDLKITNNGNVVDVFHGEISYIENTNTTFNKLLQLGTNTASITDQSLPIEYKNFNFGLFDDMLVASSPIGLTAAYKIKQEDLYKSFCVELHYNGEFLGWAGGIHADPTLYSNNSWYLITLESNQSLVDKFPLYKVIDSTGSSLYIHNAYTYVSSIEGDEHHGVIHPQIHAQTTSSMTWNSMIERVYTEPMPSLDNMGDNNSKKRNTLFDMTPYVDFKFNSGQDNNLALPVWIQFTDTDNLEYYKKNDEVNTSSVDTVKWFIKAGWYCITEPGNADAFIYATIQQIWKQKDNSYIMLDSLSNWEICGHNELSAVNGDVVWVQINDDAATKATAAIAAAIAAGAAAEIAATNANTKATAAKTAAETATTAANNAETAATAAVSLADATGEAAAEAAATAAVSLAEAAAKAATTAVSLAEAAAKAAVDAGSLATTAVSFAEAAEGAVSLAEGAVDAAAIAAAEAAVDAAEAAVNNAEAAVDAAEAAVNNTAVDVTDTSKWYIYNKATLDDGIYKIKYVDSTSNVDLVGHFESGTTTVNYGSADIMVENPVPSIGYIKVETNSQGYHNFKVNLPNPENNLHLDFVLSAGGGTYTRSIRHNYSDGSFPSANFEVFRQTDGGYQIKVKDETGWLWCARGDEHIFANTDGTKATDFDIYKYDVVIGTYKKEDDAQDYYDIYTDEGEGEIYFRSETSILGDHMAEPKQPDHGVRLKYIGNEYYEVYVAFFGGFTSKSCEIDTRDGNKYFIAGGRQMVSGIDLCKIRIIYHTVDTFIIEVYKISDDAIEGYLKYSNETFIITTTKSEASVFNVTLFSDRVIS